LYLTTINGWPNTEPPRLYSHPDPVVFIGPQIGVTRGTIWEKFSMSGVYGDGHVPLRRDGTAEWREYPTGVRTPEEAEFVYHGDLAVTPTTAPGVQGINGLSANTVRILTLGGNGLPSPRPALTPPIFEVFVPHWMPVAVFALPPLAWMLLRGRRLVVRRRRKSRGLCLGCGYDLRASSGRCPECGREAAMPAGVTPAC
jgi:hypothetical protein